MTSLTENAVQLRGRLSGELVGASDPGYDQARAVFNAMIDRHPELIARCTSVSDVQQVLAYGQAADAPIVVRGGGHSAPGFGTADGAIVIDLSPMQCDRGGP